MINQVNQKIAEDFLCAYKAHDWEGIRNLLHADIKWTLPGDGVISGTAEGMDAVIERTKIIIGGGVQTELHHILVGQKGLTLSLNNTATSADGRILDEELATVLTVDNGLIGVVPASV